MKKITSLFLFFVLFIGNAIGQSSTGNQPKTPREAVKMHLHNLTSPKSKQPSKSIQAFDWSETSFTKEEKIEIAHKLWQIFDAEAIEINYDRISNDPNFIDGDTTNGGQHIYVIAGHLPNIYLIKNKETQEWLYSSNTVKAIPKIFKEEFPLGLHHLASYFHHNFKTGYKFLGLKVFQLIGLLIIIISLLIIYKLCTYLFQKLIGLVIQKFAKARLAAKYIVPVAKPLSLLFVFYLATLFISVLQLPITMGKYLVLSMKAAIPFFAMLVVYKLIDILIAYLEKLAERTESTLDDQLVPLLRKALKVFVIIVGILFVLANFEFDITALLAGLSVGGLALALAAQDLLKNFFGSIMIFLDRPFQVGDWVTASGIDGDIEEVGFRATRIRTFHNSVTYVPNGKLADMVVDNMGLRKYRRYKTYIAVTYDTPPALLNAFVDGLRKIVDTHPDTRKDYYNVYVNTFNNSSIDILFYIFFAVPTWPQELNARHEVNVAIMKLAEELGVRFAFPTQTIHVEDMPEKEPKTPVYGELQDRELKEKVDKFIVAEYSNKPQK